jgi:hypothetical protein
MTLAPVCASHFTKSEAHQREHFSRRRIVNLYKDLRPKMFSFPIGMVVALSRGMENHPPKRARDRHRHSFMIRLPKIFHGKLQALGQRLHKPMTAVVKMALKQLFAAAGFWSKKDDRELEREEGLANAHEEGPDRGATQIEPA